MVWRRRGVDGGGVEMVVEMEGAPREEVDVRWLAAKKEEAMLLMTLVVVLGSRAFLLPMSRMGRSQRCKFVMLWSLRLAWWKESVMTGLVEWWVIH